MKKMLVFIFIKCRFNFQLLASVNIISFQVFPFPHQKREGEKAIFNFYLTNV